MRKGLGDVVVGPAVDPLYLLVPAAARRQHQDGKTQPGVAPLPQQRQAVDFGEPEVEHRGVVALGMAQEVGALAVGRAVDGVSGLRQRARQLPGQPSLVFDDQYAQGWSTVPHVNLNGS
jgi:hypothetical protein